MPVEITTVEAEFPVPFGHLGTYSVYVGTTEYDFSKFKVVKKLNQMSSFEFVLDGVNRSDTNIAENKTLTFFIENSLFLKGRIDKIEYKTDDMAVVKGYGMEVKLLDKTTDRTSYVSQAADTVLGKILSQNNDNNSPWILSKGSIENYGNITIRSDFDNKLRFASELSKLCLNSSGTTYDWWVSQVFADSYATDYFNLTPYKGSQSSVLTFYVSGADQNVLSTTNEQDVQALWNYVTCLGYGDGTNQIKTSFYNATGDGSIPEYTIMTTALTSSGTSATVADGSKLATSGICIIGEEQCSYTRSGNTLMLTRGQGGTTAKAHPKNIYIADYVSPTEATAETGSSINLYGLKKMTISNSTIIDEQELQKFASRLLLEHLSPYTRIVIEPMDAIDTLNSITLGDKVTVIDEDTGLNDDYRVVGFEFNFDTGIEQLLVEVSNRKLYLIEQLQQVAEDTYTMGTYAQGATNVWGDTQQGSASATVPLTLNFYVSSDIVDASGKIKINSAKLSYKSDDYKKYVATSLSGNPTLTGNPALTGTPTATTMGRGEGETGYNFAGYSNTVVGNDTWQTVGTGVNISSIQYLFHGVHGCISIEIDGGSGIYWDVDTYIRIKNSTDSTYYPDTTGWLISNPSYSAYEVQTMLFPFYIHLPWIWQNKTYFLEYKISNENNWTGYNKTIRYSYHGSQAHTDTTIGTLATNSGTLASTAGTLATSYGLSEVTTSSTDTIIKIYDSSNNLLWNSGARGAITENEVDISAYITGSGYYKIELIPNNDATMYGTVAVKAGVDS